MVGVDWRPEWWQHQALVTFWHCDTRPDVPATFVQTLLQAKRHWWVLGWKKPSVFTCAGENQAATAQGMWFLPQSCSLPLLLGALTLVPVKHPTSHNVTVVATMLEKQPSCQATEWDRCQDSLLVFFWSPLNLALARSHTWQEHQWFLGNATWTHMHGHFSMVRPSLWTSCKTGWRNHIISHDRTRI
jgi:hypothetical protein